MLRTGVDIVEVNRVKRAIEQYGERFTGRIFTDAEYAYCRGRFISLAARFAAKEAVSKALGTGIGDYGWLDIEIAVDESGMPVVKLHGRAAEIAHNLGLVEWSISLSHTENQAVAFVVAMG